MIKKQFDKDGNFKQTSLNQSDANINVISLILMTCDVIRTFAG